MSKTLDELRAQAIEVSSAYRKQNADQGFVDWSASDYVQGFMTDVGDLAKQIMIHEKKRGGDGDRQKIEHELADCLYSVLVIAHELNIDLGSAFESTMKELKTNLGDHP